MAQCHKDGIICHKYGILCHTCGIFCQYAILLAYYAILWHIMPYLWHIMPYLRHIHRFYRHWFSHDVHGKMADSGAAVAADAYAAAEARDDSKKQGASKGRTTKLPLTSSDDSPKSPQYAKPPPHEGDSGVYISAVVNADAEEAGRTGGTVGIVYPLGGEEADAVNYEVGALLLAKALGATVYPFTDKQSLFRAIEKAGADQVDTLFLIGHGSENGSFGPSPNERLKTTAAEVVSKLLRAKLTQVVLVCCCAGTIAAKYSMQVCGRTHDIA